MSPRYGCHDRELLELAAQAAGIEFDPEKSTPHPVSGSFWGLWLRIKGEPHEGQRRYWSPLADDGDALRLAVKLNIEFACFDDSQKVNAGVWSEDSRPYDCMTPYNGDKQAATRRAIVRAAAEIGRAVQ